MLEAYLKEKTLRALEARLPSDLDSVTREIGDLVANDSASPHALWVLARCQIIANEPDEAIGTLEALLEQDSDHVLATTTLAKLLLDRGNVHEAVRLLSALTDARPEIAEIWKLLGEYLLLHGRTEASSEAQKQYEMIKAFNARLQVARQAFANADFKMADEICRQLLHLVPNEIRVLRLLCRIGSRFRYYEFSTSTLATCVEARPNDVVVRLEYADALLRSRRYREALAQCDTVIETAPEMIDAYDLKAETLYHLGRYDEAIQIYRELVGVGERRAVCLVHLGKVLKTIGETEEAIACYRQAKELEPRLGQAYWELANLKTFQFSVEEVSAMQRLARGDECTGLNKVLVRFALGKALEDAEEFEASFQSYQEANRAYLATRPFQYSSNAHRFISFFGPEYFSVRKEFGAASDEAIFVVGMPRSGSTLVEQILSSHSLVDATQELDEIVSIARTIGNPTAGEPNQYPQCMAGMSVADSRVFAQRYLDFARQYRGDAPHFVDKAPHNFQHVGLIKTLLPNAKIIDVRRNPMATGWSLYRQFFAESYEFSYDLETIGKYYNDYLELMNHWHRVLPGQILTVYYEDLIGDLRSTTEAILSYCGLDFEEACLSFHLNDRAVATPSSEQVRQPLYGNAVEHWRNYEPFLGALGQAIESNAHAAGE